MIRVLILGVLPLAMLSASAFAVTLDLVTNDGDVLNHYPGADGLIGTVDDVISANPSATNGSFSNTLGTYSYNAFDFGNGNDPALPSGKNAITFIEGTVTIDANVATVGGGPLVTGFEVSGTEPFFGHGPYSASITSVNAGTYDPVTGAITLDMDFDANLDGSIAPAVGFSVAGDAWFVEASDFGVGTGNDYVDDVLIPLAQSLNAPSIFFAHISGTVPASPGAFGQMPIEAVLVGVAPVPVPPAILLIMPALMGLVRIRKPT